MDIRHAQNAEEFNTGMTIKMVSTEGIIEESAGRRKFCLDRNGMFLDYEKRMLCDSGCPYTLPMHFATIEGKEKAYYDFTGFLQLEDHIRRNSENDLQGRNNHKPVHEVLELLSKILDGMKGMDSYLLFPERFSIHQDAIFVHSDGYVSFAYYMNENPELPLQGRIVLLVENLIRLYRDDDVEQYLIKYKEMILMKNPGLDGMIGILGTLKREVSYIYWNIKSFRREEENHNHPENTNRSPDQTKENRIGLRSLWKKDHLPKKLLALQVGFAAILITVLLSGSLEFTSFVGVAVLTAGADLWLMKKLGMVGPDIYN